MELSSFWFVSILVRYPGSLESQHDLFGDGFVDERVGRYFRYLVCRHVSLLDTLARLSLNMDLFGDGFVDERL